VADVLVQLLARHARLHHRVEVGFVHRQHLVHLAHVDAHAALHRQDVAFERGADTVGNHRNLVAAADVDDIAHFLSGSRKYHGVGRCVRKVGFVLAVLLADAARGGGALAQQGLELVD
jgi:hypothetical protein